MITRNQERRIRIDIAIRDVMTKTFQHYLGNRIVPSDLISHIKKCGYKYFNDDEKKILISEDFSRFDIPLLNKLFRNYGDSIFKGCFNFLHTNEMPYAHQTTVADDFNRLRISRNKYVHQIKTENEDITIEAMEEIKKEFIDICLRMKERNLPQYKEEEYVSQLQIIFSDDIDRIEELHKRVTILERCARKRPLEEDLQAPTHPKRRKKSIRRSILKLSENSKQLKKSKVILIVGEYGVGKSSFINSVLTAITGRYSEHCEVAQASSSKTNFLHVKSPEDYFLEEEDMKLWYPTFLDMVGMDKANLYQFGIILEYILEGRLKPFTDITDFCNNIKAGHTLIETNTREGPIVDVILFLWAPKIGKDPTDLVKTVKDVLRNSAKEIPIFVVLTKMDECDLSTEEKEELKREICNICVISMDRILECINYKRPEIQLGWWNKDAEEKILNFITSICDPHLQRKEIVRMKFKENKMSSLHDHRDTVLLFAAFLILLLVLAYIILCHIIKIASLKPACMKLV